MLCIGFWNKEERVSASTVLPLPVGPFNRMFLPRRSAVRASSIMLLSDALYIFVPIKCAFSPAFCLFFS